MRMAILFGTLSREAFRAARLPHRSFRQVFSKIGVQFIVRRIEICGGIATGKSSLARCLTYDGTYQLVEERFREVPFWEKFYAAPDQYAFEKNVSFLLFHTDSIRDAMN